MRRVVVTGMGMVTPLACGVEPTWQRLLAGKSGARKVEAFDVSDMPCKIACSIPRGDGTNGTFNADQWMEPKEQRKVDKFITYAMCAARQALEDSGWKPEREEDQFQTGVMIGSGIGGVEGIGDTAITFHERGARRVSPFFVTGRIINLASGYVWICRQTQGPQPRGCDRLLDRRTCHRRRIAADCVGRRGGDGSGRNRIPGQPHFDGGICRLPRALHRLRSEEHPSELQ